MMQGVRLLNGNLWLSYAFLKENGVTDKQLEVWSYRQVSVKEDFNGKRHVLYSSICKNLPDCFPAENDLIGLVNEAAVTGKIETYKERFEYAYSKGYIKYLQPLKEKYPQVKDNNIKTAARLMAAFEYIIEQKTEHRNKDTEAMYKAFRAVYGKYKSYNCFANAVSKAMKHGAESVAVKKTWYTAPLNVKTIPVIDRFWAACVAGIPKKYGPTAIHRKLVAMCNEVGKKPPSDSWVKKFYREIQANPAIYKVRNGADEAKKKEAFATLDSAAFANERWMIDGKQMPFLGAMYQRHQFVFIQDDYSTKIIGWALGKSENTIVIMDAYKMAINETGYLPYEILTDNHSFNKTSEAGYFTTEIKKIGTTYDVSSNPQKKSKLERSNRTLDDYFKEYYGFTGQGIKAKNSNARPSQEYIDKVAKDYLTEQEILENCIAVINQWNNRPYMGSTPEQLYNESKQPYSFKLDLEERIRVTTPKGKFSIRRNQINITRGPITYEFIFNIKDTYKHKEKEVAVRYEDLSKGIYVFDIETDEFLFEAYPKPVITATAARQTEKDKLELHKHNARKKAYEAMGRKEIEELKNGAEAINPDAVDILNRHTTPKDILRETERQANLKKDAIKAGLNFNNISKKNRGSEVPMSQLLPVKKDTKHPFKTNGDMSPVNPEKDLYNGGN